MFYAAVIIVKSFGLLPQVGAFGVVDSAEDALFGKGDVLADCLYQAFHVFALSDVICGTRILHHGQVKPFHRGENVVFLDVDEGADERYAALVHVGGGGEAGETSLVEERHQHGFRHVVRIVAESEFAAAKTVDLAVERAAAEFRAKGAGVGLLPRVEYDLGDVRLYDVSFHAYRAAIF